jgi:Protein of unknown function (DUF2958)
MELLPDEIRKKLPPLYAQEHEKDPMVYVKFFHPMSYWTWYATEGSPEDDDFIFFGWVYGDFPELGYFSLNELESVKDPIGLGIERDLHFTPTRLSEVKKLHEATPSRQPDVVVSSIEGPEPDFSPIAHLAERMATLYLTVNYKRSDWITNLDENRICDAANAAFTRVAPVLKAVYDIYHIEMVKEVFVSVFESQATPLLSEYLVKWHRWQSEQQPKDRDDE